MKLSNTRLGLVVTMAVLLSAVRLTPVGIGLTPGTDLGSAPTVAPGYYPNESRDVFAYYNVSCTVGANLTVIITYAIGEQSELELYAPNGTMLDISNSGVITGVEVVSTICEFNLLYTIRVVAPNGPTPQLYNLMICLGSDCGQGGGIPGFALCSAVFGIVTLLGIVVLSKKRIMSFI